MTETMPLVTIAIPTYKRADSYLPLAIQSALAQTYPRLEVIVSDNCSPDDTEQVVNAFSSPVLRYFRHERNIGANNNFNFCLQQARGTFFMLFQDDDLIDRDFVEQCMQGVDGRLDVGIVRSGTRIIDSHGRVLKESPNGVGGLSTADFIVGWFKGKTALYLCSTLFNTRRLRELGGFGSRHDLFQDVVAEVQLAAHFGRVDVPAVLASFRKHAGEMTSSARVMHWCEDSRYLFDLICGLVEENERPRVEREGLLYFSRINYQFAAGIENPLKRALTNLRILRQFEWRYPPIYFSVIRKNRGRLRRTARVTRDRLLALGPGRLLDANNYRDEND